MYDELVKNLRICSRCDFGQDCNGCTQKSDDAFCCDKLLHEAADAVEELSRENESLANSVNEASDILRRRWIPVTERLPCLTTPVLATDGIEVDIAWMYGVPPRWITSFTAIDEDKLTHWMPLPKTPKEES